MKVLVVDDNPIDRMMLIKMLNANGYDVVEARNGLEALEVISSEKPDIVISDIMMPVMDGYMLLRQIRKSKSTKELPFVFYSASYVTEKDMELAVSLGVSRFIIKPIEPRQLLQEISQTLFDISSGKLKTVETIPIKDEEYLKEYSRRIFNKLEEKLSQLEREIEERKRVEEELRKSEAQFRATFEQSAIGMASVDIEGRILETNRILQHMLGYKDEELREKLFTDLIHPDDVELYKDQFMELINGRKDHYFIKIRYIRKKSMVFWVRLTVSLVRDSKGDPDFAISMVEDITERKEAEEKLQQSEEKYRTLVQNILDGVFIIQDMKIQFANDAFGKIIGYEVEDIIGKDLRDFIAPENREMVSDYNARRQLGESILSEYEINIIFKGGNIRKTAIISAGLILYQGRTAIMGTLKDITERKQAELLLRRSKEFAEIVLNSINDPISIINVKDFTIIDTNKAFLEIYGIEKEQVIGKVCHKISHKKNIPCPEEDCPLLAAIKTGKSSVCEHSHIVNKGATNYVEVSAYPILNEKGEIGSVVHVARDITQRKQAEIMIKEKARAELYGFIVSALPVFASGVPSHVRDVLIKNFSERFEKNVKRRFDEELKQKHLNDDPQQLLEFFMEWLSALFFNFGIENRTTIQGKKRILEFKNCPWINEARGNPIFCFICRSLAKRSFTWIRQKGSVEQKSSIASGSKICKFDIQVQKEMK